MNKTTRFLGKSVVVLLLGTAAVSAADLSAFTVYPNPVRVYQGHAQAVFDAIPGAKVSIYTAQGSLVRERALSDAETQFLWDLKNDSDREVASGIYIYMISSGDDEKTGKLAIIR